jgi:GNAT superfamily N-acetyltransferase
MNGNHKTGIVSRFQRQTHSELRIECNFVTDLGTFGTMTAAIHSGYRTGCIGRIAELHAITYRQLSGFGLQFESKVARELAEFCERYDDERDGLWLAVSQGQVEGSIAIDGLHAGREGAHLRWFIVSDKLRGAGIGKDLLTCATTFCRSKGYKQVYLWTFEGLGAARHLYENFGFRLVEQRPGAQWGKQVIEQRFELRA